jgi:AcrR family transcriptional regulator
MEKKDLKEQRIKRYFIDSAKNMIRSEGVTSVSVRSVADDAGYSASTLYTYFKEINELLMICLFEFIDEIKDYIIQNMNKELFGNDKIKDFYNLFTRYFIQYPSIFQLVYIESNSFFRSNYGSEKNLGERLIDLIKSELSADWKIALTDKSDNELDNLQRNLYYSVLGQLLSYINRNEPKDYKEYINNYRAIFSLYNI